MMYTPIDLGPYCTDGLILREGRAAPPLGDQLFHGLPFRIPADPEKCFIAPPPRSPIRIVLERGFRYAIIAHRLLTTGSGDVGDIVAEYAFSFEDGEST